MFLSELQRKAVINIVDGRDLGIIVDVRIEVSCGKIITIIVSRKSFFGLFGGKEELEIAWAQIIKMGEDVILVKVIC